MHTINGQFPTAKKIVALALISMSSLAFAAGNHAGGHGHDSAETAIGKPGVVAKASRSVTIEMSDSMRFTPADIKVKQGETIRFIIKNTGKIPHELSLGTQKELMEHLELMKKYPGMEHDEPNSITLAPGKEGQIVWQFTKAGTVDFACLIPGHYEAGMKGAVAVSKK